MTYRALLKNKNYRWLLLGQLFSAGGSALTSLGLLWYVTVDLGSPALAGLLGAAWGLPAAFSFVAGVIADQTDRRRLMIKVDIVSAALLLILAAGLHFQGPSLTPSLRIAFIIFIVFILSMLREFFVTAMFAFLPSIVDGRKLVSANSLLNASQQGALAVSRVVGGGVLAIGGIVGILLIDAISYSISGATLTLIPAGIRENLGSASTENRVGTRVLFRKQIVEVKKGLSQMWDASLIRDVVPWALPANAAYGAMLVLLPGWVNHRLNGGPVLYGLLIGVGTVGFMTGSLLAPFVANRYPANWIMGSFTIAQAIALYLFSLTTDPAMAVVLFVLMNIFDGLSSPVFFSLLQVQIPAEYLGRIFGGLMRLLALGQPLGMAIGGTLAESRGLTPLFIVSAALIGLTGLRFLFIRALQVRLPTSDNQP